MALLLTVFAPEGLAPEYERIYRDIREKLLGLVAGLSIEERTGPDHMAARMWLPHSRSWGFGAEERTGDWLALAGNPTAAEIQGVPPESLGLSLLEKYREKGPSAITDLCVPFAVIMHDSGARALHIFTDRMGMQHLYLYRGEGFFVVCSSSLALAASVPVHLDPCSLAAYFQLRYLPGQRTFFSEIEKLEPALWRTISREGEKSHRYWEPPARSLDGDVGQWAGELVRAGVEATDLALRADVPTTVEITGGLDSRFNLACALETGKAFTGFTIGAVVEEDVEIAKRLAKARAFRHVVVSPLEELVDTFDSDLEEIHRLSDGQSDLLNVIMSPAANRQAASLRGQSVTGITGEIFRGRYFWSTRPFSGELDRERLLEWQLRLGSGYRPDLFREGFRDAEGALLRKTLSPLLAEYEDMPGTWRSEYFDYKGPLQGAAGRSMTFNNFYYRQAAPQCSNRMLDLSFRIPGRIKKRSGVVRMAVSDCDPVLAEIPLAGGRLARPWRVTDVLHAARYGWTLAGKARRKLAGRFFGTPAAKRVNRDLEALTNRRLGHLSRTLLSTGNMASIGIYNPDWLEAFLESNREEGFPDQAQVGLILSMEMTSRYVGANLRLP